MDSLVRIKRVITVETVIDRSSYPDNMSDRAVISQETDRDKVDLLDQILDHELAMADLDKVDITTQVTFEDV